MEDGLQDRAGGICDVRILPVEGDEIGRAIPVPETQHARTRRDRELLIERAVAQCLGARPAVDRRRLATRECGLSAGVRVVGADYRGAVVGAVNYPGWKAAGLESLVLDYPGVAPKDTRKV